MAIPEFLSYFDHFLRVDFGDDYIEHLDEPVVIYGNRKETLRERIYDWFQQFVYSINQPASARNYQSCFTNISYYDKYYFNSIFKDFVFPDGDEPKWETTKELQKIFMRWFNNERSQDVLTFPVETLNLLTDKETHKYKDEETADFTAEMWSKGHSFFMYNSDSADALSSCCFAKDQRVFFEIDAKAKECRVNTFEKAYTLTKDHRGRTYNRNGQMVGCTVIKLPNRPMYKVITEDNFYIKVSDNHLNPTLRGDIETVNLTTEDSLLMYDGESAKIKSIERIEYNDDIYCLEMDDKNDPYFLLANGIITHNCRLKNAIEENQFSYTLGAGGIETGSKKVITININHMVQDWYKVKDEISLPDYTLTVVDRVHKYLTAWNEKLWDDFRDGILTVYDAGFIDLDKQYLTVGFNGFIEGAEFLSKNDSVYNGIEIDPDNEMYKKYASDILTTIKNRNLEHRTDHCKFNTEQTPCENAGHKLYEWDKKAGYVVPTNRNMYNSYFYPVEDETFDPIKKMKLQGKDFIGCLDGGSAYHCNLSEHLSKEQYRTLMDIAVDTGCSYFTFNIPNTVCDDCGHIDKRMLKECPVCHSKNLDYLTRIIGYLRRISNFSSARQEEAAKRYYGDMK